MLRAALAGSPNDGRAAYLLGCLLYDKDRHDEAVGAWERAAELLPDFPTVHRNLGIAFFNVKRDPQAAIASYERAIDLNPDDGRVLFELDQLRRRVGISPSRRLEPLTLHRRVVETRDDPTIELASLLLVTGNPEEAGVLVRDRRLHPWEGGEGKVLATHERLHLMLGRRQLRRGNPASAKQHLQLALECPGNLGESRHLLAETSEICLHLALASKGMDDPGQMEHWLSEACMNRGESVATRESCFRAVALRINGNAEAANQLLLSLEAHGQELLTMPAKIDYFATSLPNLLVFDDDLQTLQERDGLLLCAFALLGMGKRSEACHAAQQIVASDPANLDALAILAGEFDF